MGGLVRASILSHGILSLVLFTLLLLSYKYPCESLENDGSCADTSVSLESQVLRWGMVLFILCASCAYVRCWDVYLNSYTDSTPDVPSAVVDDTERSTHDLGCLSKLCGDLRCLHRSGTGATHGDEAAIDVELDAPGVREDNASAIGPNAAEANLPHLLRICLLKN